MIFTEQKPTSEILQYLESHHHIFLVGCGTCAATWHTGGEPEVKAMNDRLEKGGKAVTGWMVVEVTCDQRQVRRDARAHREELAEADAVLVMACGAGIGTLALNMDSKPVYPALNTLFLGRLERLSKADERCALCGECIVAQTGGLCPLATCPKELLNGPCGGYRNDKCEVDPEQDCTWILIYERLIRLGQVEKLQQIHSPKDQSKRKHPRMVDKASLPLMVQAH